MGRPGRPRRGHRRQGLRDDHRPGHRGDPAGHRTAQGAFVFRLAGRERQQSASYYTPEVLTRFVVSQALEELLDQDGTTTTAAEILELTICEPALGSGAFAIEAVRQLADAVPRRAARTSSARRSTPTTTRASCRR